MTALKIVWGSVPLPPPPPDYAGPNLPDRPAPALALVQPLSPPADATATARPAPRLTGSPSLGGTADVLPLAPDLGRGPLHARNPEIDRASEVMPERPEDLFDYVEGGSVRRGANQQPGYFAAILRGTESRPVFSRGENWFTRGASDAGNWILDELASSASDLVHTTARGGVNIPLTDQVVLGFTASARKLREDEIPPGDPRLLGIEELRSQQRGALPVWLEGSLGQSLGLNLNHAIPIGQLGSVNFGFAANESLGLTMNRLLYLPDPRAGSRPDDHQLARLMLLPTRAAEMARMETGATFRLQGSAGFRIDGALGLGASVPALSNVLRVGASVDVGAYAALSGQFTVQLQRLEQGRARMTLTSMGNAEIGARLQALVGVQVSYTDVQQLLRGFVDYVANGGDPAAFRNQLSRERERELASDMSGYMRLLAKNIAENAGIAALDRLIQRYATAYFEAKAGVDIAANFSMTIDFDLNNPNEVTLPDAAMVPEALRRGVPEGKPVRVRIGELAGLAYDMAVHGDLRLVQQLTQGADPIRTSGVRINERTTTEVEGRSESVDLSLLFLNYRRAQRTSDTVIDRFTPELGRTRTAIAQFNREYQGLFGDAETASADVRVHTPDGAKHTRVFFGSNENFSADFVVQNLVENWTNYGEMESLLGVLNVLSRGRLEKRAYEALASGQYRNDSIADGLNPIHQLFFKPREYGRSVAHLHVWLSEDGLRQLFEKNLSETELYRRIGAAFHTMGMDRTGRAASIEKYVVDNILRLQAMMHAAETPEQEEVVARSVRNFLRDASDKLPAYAALASLVEERYRAVEMRLAAIRDGAVPIRFTYIQDGRTSELLYATGFARVAMQQYQRFQAVLDVETRLRVGNLLTEMHRILNAPSPDPYELRTTMRALDAELVLMDRQGARMSARIARDIGFGRAFLDGLPSASVIQAILPDPIGTELATLRLHALRNLNDPAPNLLLLRDIFQNLLRRMPQYRAIAAVAPIVTSVARLAETTKDTHPEINKEAQKAIETLRAALRDIPDANAAPGARLRTEEPLRAAQAVLADVHARLLAVAADESAADGAVTVDEREPQPSAAGGESTAALDRSRRSSGDRYRKLAGNPQVGPLSYFERAGVVPPFYMGTPYTSAGDGIVTGSMLREAELAMATSRPKGELGLPSLAKESQRRFLEAARVHDSDGFLRIAEELAFPPAVVLEDPGKHVMEYLLVDIPHSERRAFLEHFSLERRSRLEKIFAELDSTANVEARRDVEYQRARNYFLRDNARYREDLRFLEHSLRSDPKNLEAVMNTLGYGRTVDTWHTRGVARLEAVLSQLTGDELRDLLGALNDDERRRFFVLVSNSDLRPQTRAKLAGGLVDNDCFWRLDEQIVEGLVTGMNAGDLRLFFDQLHTDGKLEDFLQPTSFWEFLLIIFSFGLALLWIHDNEAALRVVASQGWSADELMAEYRGRRSFLAQIERDAEDVLFQSTIDTIPMDAGIRGGLRVLHTVIGNVKYYHFADLPEEAAGLLREMAAGAGKQLARRLADIARQGGSPAEIAAEYKRFFAGLSPSAIEQQLHTGDTDGSVAMVAKALSDGALAGLVEHAMDPRNRFFTEEVLMEIMLATTQLDSPIRFGPGTPDTRVDAQDYQELLTKAAFYSRYTGFDFSQAQILYGGFAVRADATAMGPTISLAPSAAPMVNGQITMDDAYQQVIAFHETTHILQQMVYGGRLNAFVDQLMHLNAGRERGAAYDVTEAMFDRATSINDFQEHWEQQAEMMEVFLRTLWAQSLSNPAGYENHPGTNPVLTFPAGATLELTPARWNKMLGFLREFGAASRRALGRTGGRFVMTGARP